MLKNADLTPATIRNPRYDASYIRYRYGDVHVVVAGRAGRGGV